MDDIESVNNVRKKLEFEEFIKMIEKRQVHTWVMCAKVLGVRPATISEWKKYPEARKAIISGIENALENMELVGKNDWRMWREKLRLLGVDKEIELSDEDEDNKIEVIMRDYRSGREADSEL